MNELFILEHITGTNDKLYYNVFTMTKSGAIYVAQFDFELNLKDNRLYPLEFARDLWKGYRALGWIHRKDEYINDIFETVFKESGFL